MLGVKEYSPVEGTEPTPQKQKATPSPKDWGAGSEECSKSSEGVHLGCERACHRDIVGTALTNEHFFYKRSSQEKREKVSGETANLEGSVAYTLGWHSEFVLITSD